MIRCMLVIAAASCLGGCFSHYTDGPEFREISVQAVPPGQGLVYVYREKAAWGAIHRFTAGWESRWLDLYSGAYGVFVLPEGKQTLFGSSKVSNVTVDVSHDRPVFVRVEFDRLASPQKSVIVSAAEARDEIESLHLAPGGGARTPVLPKRDTRPKP